MPDDITLRPLGRVSEPSHNVAPSGSLLVAKNCVIREQGAISPAPDLSADISTGSVTGGAYNISPVFTNGATNEQLVFGLDVSGPTERGLSKTSALGTEIQFTDPEGNSASVAYPIDGNNVSIRMPMYETRDSVYVMDKRGVLKWETTAESDLEPIYDRGWVSIDVTLSTGTGSWLTAGDYVNYVAVVVWEDDNGVIRRSSPCIRTNTGTNGSLTKASVEVNIAASFASLYSTIRGVEVYRTKQVTSPNTLPNEYHLLAEIPYSDFSPATNSEQATITDVSPDADLGSALYTSGSREGLTGSNIAPPEALSHAEFGGSQFWGNVAEPSVYLFVTKDNGSSTPFAYSDTGYQLDGTTTVTAVAVSSDFEVGQFIETITGSPEIPIGTYITALTATTITLSAAATTSNNVDIRTSDVVYVLYGDGTSDRLPLEYAAKAFATTIATERGYEDEPGYGPNYSYTESSNPNGDIVVYDAVDTTCHFSVNSIHRTARSGEAQYWASNASRYESPVADLSTTDGAPTTGGTEGKALHKNRIYWSKPDEPEHTTLLSFQDIGSTAAGNEIVAMASTRDSLFIFKTDGVFRLTGSSAADTWRVDPFDTSVTIIGRETVRVMDNAVYALSDQGIVKVTEAGVERLSDSIVGDWIADRTLAAYDYYTEHGEWPPFIMATANQSTREYILCMNTGTVNGTGDEQELLVYNAKTGAWYTWLYTQVDDDSAVLTHLQYSPIGDYQSASSTGVNRPGVILGTDNTTAEILLQEAVSGTDEAVDVQFRVKTGGDPTHLKLWKDAVFDCKRDTGASGTVSAQFVASDEDTAVTLVTADNTDGNEIRMWVPRAQARNGKLLVGLKGTGLTVYGLRLTFSSSGREAPLD